MNDGVRGLIDAVAHALGPVRGAERLAPSQPSNAASEVESRAVEGFLATLSALGGVGCEVDGIEAARSSLRKMLQEDGASTVVRWADPLLDELCGVPEDSLRAFGCQIDAVDAAADRGERVSRIAEADAGIVVADFALAQTGTIAHRSGGARLKSVSLLPPMLIAIVPRTRVYETLSPVIGEVRAWLSDPGVHQGLQLISGPSRSSDIENDLTIGVHGPGKVRVLVVNG